MEKYSSMMIRLLLAAMTVSACTGNVKTERQEKVIPVKVINLAPSAIPSERAYVGTVEESFALSLGFSNMGNVEQVFVAEGQKVMKGQLLASLNTATAQNACNAALSTLRQAQDAYDRLSKVHGSGSLPDIRWVEVETGLQQARSTAAIAQKTLDDCSLYAPCSGIVAQRLIEPGAQVMPGIAAFKIITVDRVNVKISVPENEIGRTFAGQEASVEVPALGNETFGGKIKMKGVIANPLSHTYEVKIDLANPQERLMPGMVCKVRLQQPEQLSGIVVPNRAVQVSHDGRHFVWLADDGKARRRFVKTGVLSDFGVMIADGLSDGEQLIVEGYTKISEGMKVAVMN
jgi:RND family efflux transporter MFP subunit